MPSRLFEPIPSKFDAFSGPARAMSRPLRSFIALDASLEVAGRAKIAVDRLRTADADVKWIDPDHLHITLKFLGGVPMMEIDAVCRAVDEAVRELPPFEIELSGVGAFPSSARPRTIWLGLTRGAESVAALADAVDAGLAPLGFPKEPRAYRPHLTLGRVRRASAASDRLPPVIEELADFDAGTIYADAAVIYSSELARKGPKYSAIDHAELRGAVGERRRP